MAESMRFYAGDKIRVFDKDGWEVCRGTALHTRGYFGYAEFQVMLTEGRTEPWVRTYNLNFYRTEVL